ncbi:MAG: RES family NAD+ phosphorylase [Gemmatimonadaceae bacterium]
MPPRVRLKWVHAYHAMTAPRPNVVLALASPGERAALEAALQRNLAADRLAQSFSEAVYPTRYTDGTFPAFYLAQQATTAIAEKMHHTAHWLAKHHIAAHPHTIVLVHVDVDARVDDLRTMVVATPALSHATDYTASQQQARTSRAAGAQGVLYSSVRDPQGHDCAATFDESTLAEAQPHTAVRLEWNGTQFI